MKKVSTKLIYSITSFMLMVTISSSYAQDTHRDMGFKKGEEFERQIVINSNSALQRGDQKLILHTYSALTETYKVNDITNNSTNVSITINKLIDTVNALGQKVIFDSQKPTDHNSHIQKSLSLLIGKQALISVDQSGKVLSVEKQLPLDDTLVSFAGIQNEHFANGDFLTVVFGFPVNPLIKKGYSWTDSTATTVNKFTINDVTGQTTTITYTSANTTENLNSRTNGTVLIDNQSGLILKRLTQSVTTGYEILKGVVYTAIRRTAITEVCYKKPDTVINK